MSNLNIKIKELLNNDNLYDDFIDYCDMVFEDYDLPSIEDLQSKIMAKHSSDMPSIDDLKRYLFI